MFGYERLEARLRTLEEKLAYLMAIDQANQKPVEKPSEFKLSDEKMQEGIANLMGYDPFCRKDGDG